MVTRDGIANRLAESAIGMLPDSPRIFLRRVLRKYKEKTRLRNADITVIAHPKSGSTWLRFQLARVYQRKFNLPEAMIPQIESYHRLNPAIPRLHMAGYEYIKHTIARPAPDRKLAGKRVVFVVRHPIDVVVSLYFHILKHAARERKLFNNWPLSLDGVSVYDFALNSDWGLREAIAFYNGCARHAVAMPDAMIISYEEMRTETADVLRRLVRFAGTDVGESEIKDVVDFTSFERLREAERTNSFNSYRLRPGNPDDPESFKVRRAKIFGYRDYFDTDELIVLESIVRFELHDSFGYSNIYRDNTDTGRE